MFTISAREILQQATKEKTALRHNYLGTEHILLAFADYQEKHSEIVPSLGVTHSAIFQEVARSVGTGMHKSKWRLQLTANASQMLLLAAGIAVARGHTQIQPMHLLLAILQAGNGVAYELLERLGVDLVSLLARVDLAAEAVPTRAPEHCRL